MVYANAGRISRDEIEQMLCNSAPDRVRGKSYRRTVPEIEYKPFECSFIIDVAIAHDLCYPVDENTFFFPALCRTDTPKEAISEPENFVNHISYLLRYPYLPDSVLHQLMIRCLRNRLAVECCWQQGMVLYIGKLHTVFVRMLDEERLRIDIYSSGEQRAYEVFWLLRMEIDSINKRLNLCAKELILEGPNEFPLGAVLGAARKNAYLFDQDGNEYNSRQMLGQFYEESYIQTMQVEKSSIVIPILPREFHACLKTNQRLRKALYEAYNEICPYCNKPISSIREMDVDHILPSKYPHPAQLKPYIDYLATCGFNIEKPDYIENYFPSHHPCNLDKRNRVNEFTLPYWHDIAAQHAPRVMQLMERYNDIDSAVDNILFKK